MRNPRALCYISHGGGEHPPNPAVLGMAEYAALPGAGRGRERRGADAAAAVVDRTGREGG